MEIARYGIALLPDAATADRALALADIVRKAGSDRYGLGDRALPHCTLFQAWFDEKDLPTVFAAVGRVAAATVLPPVTFTGVTAYRQYVFWAVSASGRTAILPVQGAIVDAVARLRAPAPDAQADRGWMSADERRSWEACGYHCAGEAYVPHITLACCDGTLRDGSDAIVEARQVARGFPAETGMLWEARFRRVAVVTCREQGQAGGILHAHDLA